MATDLAIFTCGGFLCGVHFRGGGYLCRKLSRLGVTNDPLLLIEIQPVENSQTCHLSSLSTNGSPRSQVGGSPANQVRSPVANSPLVSANWIKSEPRPRRPCLFLLRRIQRMVVLVPIHPVNFTAPPTSHYGQHAQSRRAAKGCTFCTSSLPHRWT